MGLTRLITQRLIIMGRGRKPKPIEQHIIEGTYRRARHAQQYRDKGKVDDALKSPPDTLGDAELEYWREYGDAANAIGILTLADMGLLELLAITSAELDVERVELTKEPRYYELSNSAIQQNPRVKQIGSLIKRKADLLDKFYLTPDSRKELDRADAPVDESKAIADALGRLKAAGTKAISSKDSAGE